MEFDRSSISKSLSRRSLLASAGGMALGLVSGVGRASALGITPGQFQNLGDVAAATSAAISYLASRSSASPNNSFADVSKWVYPDSHGLLDFEHARFNNLGALGKPSAWNGVIERTWSEPTVLDCSSTNGEVRLSIKDCTGVQWRPAPVPVQRTAVEEALTQRSPERYGLNIPDFPLTTSGFGTRHDMTLINTSQGWRVARDGYRESITALGGASPDYVATSNASNLATTSSQKQLHAPTSPALDQNLASSTFDWSPTVNYALQWALSRNSNYTDFSPNDCANFVSQAFKAGGYPNDGTWSPYTYAWVNNMGLRSWLLNSGKAYVISSASALAYADIVNYDWHSDGVYDHVAIVTGFPGPLVSCHSNDHKNVPWSSIAYSDTSYLFTETAATY